MPSSVTWSKLGGAIAIAAAIVVVLNLLPAESGANPAAYNRNNRGYLRSALATIPGSVGAESARKPFGQSNLPEEWERRKDTGSKASAQEVRELLSRVGREFEPWAGSGITLEMVEKAYCTEEIFESMRIQVINGSMYLVGPTQSYESRARTLQLTLLEVQAKFDLPDVDFILTTSDKCKTKDAPHRSSGSSQARCDRLAPLLSMDKLPHESQCVTVPDFAFGGWPEAFLPPWQAARHMVTTAADRMPWEGRKDAIFWRGADTNEQRKIADSSEAIQGSGNTDVHLMSWGEREAFERDFISLSDHCSFKYLLHLRGVGYSSRLKYLMLCGSAMVFPHAGENEPAEFWYHMIKHGHNALLVDPVSWENQGQPVLEAVKSLSADDGTAKRLGEASRHLAAEVLHPDNIHRYWLEILTHYSALQRFKVTLHNDAVPLESYLLKPPKVVTVGERTCKVC